MISITVPYIRPITASRLNEPLSKLKKKYTTSRAISRIPKPVRSIPHLGVARSLGIILGIFLQAPEMLENF